MGADRCFCCFAIVLLLPLPSMPCPGAVSERTRQNWLKPKQQTWLNPDCFGKNEPRKSPRPINRSAVFSGHAATVDGHHPHVPAVGRISPIDTSHRGRSSGVDLSVEI